ncbi:hypothetical protein PN459_18415 [Microcystis aeruginosa CS-567/02-A1]|uniref:hypothetical protein n=1 Tax=Microcystis aeruginosa TaxID=1126 RepID=UPI00232D2B1A|nr:hypothetical protein [Microcystis aeruginosa]MDB9401931.1 hypothetical protein [Microcystis aeruginosa CS-567/02-A1]
MWQAQILSRRSVGFCAYYRVEDHMKMKLYHRVCDGLRPAGGDQSPGRKARKTSLQLSRPEWQKLNQLSVISEQ